MESKESFGIIKELDPKTKEELCIEEVFNEIEADFIVVDSDKKTEQEINEEIKHKIEKRCWWLDKEWKEKGLPKEQIEISIGENRIMLYNFNSEIRFSENHEKELAEVFKDYYVEDPELFNEIDYLLINDRQKGSLLGNEEKFSLNGECAKIYRSIYLSPRGMRQDIDFRVPGISNFKGTAAHEICHLETKDRKNRNNNEKRSEWMEKFDWDYCHNYPDEWSEIEVDGGNSAYKNKETGEIVFNNFTFKPELCLNDYARTGYEEDMCDSRVAYFYNPELIKKVCSEKYKLAENFGKEKGKINNNKKIEIKFKRLLPNEINLPQKSAKKFTYYKEKTEDGLDM